MTTIIDGKALATKLQGEIAEKTARLKKKRQELCLDLLSSW